MIAPPASLTDVLRVLVDPTRLRILGLLEQDELSVGELARALEMAQSRVSNHLRILREARLLAERHVGRTTYLRLALSRGDEPLDLAGRLWRTLGPEIQSLDEFASDLARLGRVLAERGATSTDFFDRVAGEWDKIGVAFATGQARQRAAACVLAGDATVADLGCGTGYMAEALVGLCAKLVCVDRSAQMLEAAARKLEPLRGRTTIDPRRGELDALPIADGELDGAVAGMVLHHLSDLDGACREMHRALKPEGRVVVIELSPHREEWMQQELGDRHLGLDARDVLAALERAGFVELRLESLDDRYQPTRSTEPDLGVPHSALPLYLVRGRRPPRA